MRDRKTMESMLVSVVISPNWMEHHSARETEGPSNAVLLCLQPHLFV